MSVRLSMRSEVRTKWTERKEEKGVQPVVWLHGVILALLFLPHRLSSFQSFSL